MNETYSDIEMIREIIENIYAQLLRHKDYINNLNVFPVPDGDTGLNMTLTIQGALVNTNGNEAYSSAGDYLKDFARQMLLNSRGCSGVILALYCKGAAEILTDNDLSVNTVHRALQNGYKRAYEGTTNPREGTMLTLMRELEQKYADLMKEETDPAIIIKKTIPYLKSVLQKTPDMLPVLKKAGVVDSGGAGFVILINGIAKEVGTKSLFENRLPVAIVLSINRRLKKLLKKKPARLKRTSILKTLKEIAQEKILNLKLNRIIEQVENLVNNGIHIFSRKNVLTDLQELENSWDHKIKFRYCTEFVINAEKISSEQQIRNFVSPYGDSLIILNDGDTYKVHIHTNKPNELISSISKYGDVIFTKIDDMKKQHRNFISKDTLSYEKEQGIFCIVNGSGFKSILKELGATDVLDYGKDKPSVKQLVREINRVKAKNLIVAADDRDILMSLKYAASLSKSNIYVIDSESVISLISMLMAKPEGFDINRSAEIMIKRLHDIRYFKVARAARRTKTENGKTVEKRDFFAVYNGTIIDSNRNLNNLIINGIKKLKDESELVTLYRGISVKNRANIGIEIKKLFPDLTVEEYYGGQYGCDYYITFE
ncbi:MAG: DAK2 domain-containing protein [Spirochaetales bacterium]|nr:DAK2 domain-containing protein [Spirochaetales bacterium]